MKVKKNKNRNIDRKREWDVKDLPRTFRRATIKRLCLEQERVINPKTGKLTRRLFIKGCALLRTVRNGSTVYNERVMSV